jgi:hypothetical protein
MTPLPQSDPSTETAALKHESAEGFTIKTGLWRDELTAKLEPEIDLCRSMGDEYSWVMELDTTDVTPATAPDSLLDDAQFSMRITHDLLGRNRVAYLAFEYSTLASCVLKHTYLCLSSVTRMLAPQQSAGIQARYERKLRSLACMLNDETFMRLTMLEPADRPPGYFNTPHDFRADKKLVAQGHFKAPPNWKYFDDEIQHKLKMIMQELVGLSSQSLVKQGTGSDAVQN